MERNSSNLTDGNVKTAMLRFVLPYLLSCFLQTFYGMADLFVVGLYNGSETTTAVSVGSQVMHMLTVMIVGLAMGTTVRIARAVGAGDGQDAKKTIGTSVVFFGVISVLGMLVLLAAAEGITAVMMTPQEAAEETARYLFICFWGIPFITAYNVIGSIFRGAGDSKSPMIFVAAACIVNLAADFALIGGLGMGAAGAALATVIGQAVSVAIALPVARKVNFGFSVRAKELLQWDREALKSLLAVGVPVSLQDGLIQIAFIVITVIANSRGLVAATAVGIVEKLISFMFLVPSAFLSALSSVTAQNMGAKKPKRARESLRFALLITVGWGLFCCLYCQLCPQTLVGLFSGDGAVIAAGCEYLRAYSFDCVFAAVHFCFSGYFCGAQKSGISFFHNMTSILSARIPGAYLASRFFPETLYPMGLAAPAGSFVSALICVLFYLHFRRKDL